jgi:dihydroxyacetone kinase
MSATKKLINKLEDVVKDSVEGLLQCDPTLARIANVPNVIVRRDVEVVKKTFVTLISGGGSGHEPAHAGYIGHGMLTAAVLGNVFASPSVAQVLAAIRVCAGPRGCLLIIKNYTGDRLNFGMAMERARAEGFLVEMVVVADDIALPEGKGITGGRGVAGTCFVHKIAGSAAASGADLPAVLAEARACADSVRSLGIALTTCTVPGTKPSQRLADPTTYEVGLGIHGENGRQQCQLEDNMASVCAATLVGEVSLRLATGARDCALLLNNLGSLTSLELFIVAKCVISELEARGLRPVRAYVGTYMTSLEMSGVSLSILPLPSASDDAPSSLHRLDAPTSAPAWRVVDALNTGPDGVTAASVDYSPISSDAVSLNGGPPVTEGVRTIVEDICHQIIKMEPELSRCDAICGDGDCGLVMKRGAHQVLTDLAGYSIDGAAFLEGIASSIGSSMGGTSGVLLELFFRSAANTLANNASDKDDFHRVVGALDAGVESIQFYGGAQLGMRTMLDAFIPAVKQLVASAQPDAEHVLFLQIEEQLKARIEGGGTPRVEAGDARAMANAVRVALSSVKAREGCENTKTMQALAGRSNYVNTDLMKGVPDPGALAVAEAFEAAGRAMFKRVGM